MFRHTLFPTTKTTEELDRIFDSMFSSPAQNSYPATDIYPVGDDTVIEVACTGFKPDELSVYLDGNKLFIEGKKDKDYANETKEYVVKKIAKRDFKLTYNILKPIENFEAELEYGILKVTLKQSEKETKQTIKIISK